ncbi:hypothetical protein RND81_05G140600 [Saponaria officinalis]|uniref:Uncharacterized protein n=1 Tax=Saponaria officinalis TaxID=3572 RepID=A0AAW1L0U6_SAPOF
MDVNMRSSSSSSCNNSTITQSSEDEMDLRRGPWTVEEDLTLINYIAIHGEGRWNSLARCAGLKRTGKSCRLRWLNYLRPDVRRGNITLEEQLMILELHSRWGNRWSKIAQYLPGRTDNEIKNYWRTRVQKHAKQLKCDVNSKQFKDTMRYLWMPRLVERIQAASATATISTTSPNDSTTTLGFSDPNKSINLANFNSNFTPENSTNTQISDISDYYGLQATNQNVNQDYLQDNYVGYGVDQPLMSPNDFVNDQGLEFQIPNNNNNNVEQNNQQQWCMDNLWNIEDVYFLQKQFN